MEEGCSHFEKDRDSGWRSPDGCAENWIWIQNGATLKFVSAWLILDQPWEIRLLDIVRLESWVWSYMVTSTVKYIMIYNSVQVAAAYDVTKESATFH